MLVAFNRSWARAARYKEAAPKGGSSTSQIDHAHTTATRRNGELRIAGSTHVIVSAFDIARDVLLAMRVGSHRARNALSAKRLQKR